MDYRFSQSQQIGEVLVRDSLRQIARQVDYTKQTGTPIIVYNPLGWARREVVEAQVDFDFDDPSCRQFPHYQCQRAKSSRIRSLATSTLSGWKSSSRTASAA